MPKAKAKAKITAKITAAAKKASAAKKSTLKAKAAKKSAPKAKAVSKPKTAFKKTARPSKTAAKPAHRPVAKPSAPASAYQGNNVLWKLLEQKNALREKRYQEAQLSPNGKRDDSDRFHDKHHQKFSRFAGPRRRAA